MRTQGAMRRPRGFAAEMILKVLAEECASGFGDLTLAELFTRTGLPEATERDNIYMLRRNGKIETYRDDEGLT